jgi:hypothetical protein
MGVNREHKYKHKRRSCMMCKPYKMGWGNRWKTKMKEKLGLMKKEVIKNGDL